MKRKRARSVYKPYTMGQMILLPTNLEELIPENHMVRVVNKFIEQMDLSALEAKYKGGGTSSYHPQMMLVEWGLLCLAHNLAKVWGTENEKNLAAV